MRSFCLALEHNSLIVWANSNVLSALFVEFIHYFSFFMIVGPTFVVALRLLGVAAQNRDPGQLADQLLPWMWVGIVISCISGFLMAGASATQYQHNYVFFWKMGLMAAALIFGLICYSGAHKVRVATPAPIGMKLVAFVSIVLWIATILAGVQIPALTGVG